MARAVSVAADETLSGLRAVLDSFPQYQTKVRRSKMFGLIWRIYTGGIFVFFLLFLIVEELPFATALTNSILWPWGVYQQYIAGS